jgi:SAM-dependent methyltransferase/uncharacterized protein YbaR (Trm112 family)
MEPMLVCPACRTRSAERLDVRTLEPAGDVLACACGRRYPIVDGVPLILADPAAYLRDEAAMVVERDLAPEAAALLVEGGPDGAPYARWLEVLSVYLDAHWGDRATPPPDGPPDVAGLAFGAGALVAKIVERRTARVARAVELGCSVGRGLAALAAGADHVVGLDLKHGSLRRARQLLGGETVRYARRVVGRRYAPASISAGDLAVAADRVTLACGDALDPPLIHGWFDRVVALNLLDNVTRPSQLLAVLDGLCAPGGEILVSSPYAWQSGVTEEDERFGGDDPAAELVRLLGDRFTIEDEDELSWNLRRERRCAVTYRVHYVRARKR